MREPTAPDASEATDEVLVVLARGGDCDAFGELWTRHRAAARRIASALAPADLAEDVVAEAFARILKRLRGGCQVKNFGAYLNRTIRNVVIDHQRAANTRNFAVGVGPESFDQLAEPQVDPDRADPQIAIAAFQSLSAVDQEILRITLLEESPAAEVGERLGLTAGAAAVRAFRARERLREAWLVAHTRAAQSAECARQRARMGAYARGNLGLRGARSLDRHLADCEPCRKAFTEVDTVNRSLKALVLLPVTGALVAPSGLPSAWARLRNRLAQMSAWPTRPAPLRVMGTSAWPRRLLLGWAAPATIALTLSVLAVLLPSPSSWPPAQPVALPTQAAVPSANSARSLPAPVTSPQPPTPKISRTSPASGAPRPSSTPSVTSSPTTATPSAAPSLSASTALAAAPAMSGPNLVAHSGFDSPHIATYAATFCSPTAATTTCQGTNLYSWSVTGDSVDLNSAAYVPPPPGDPSGTQCVDLIGQDFNASGRDGLRQTFATSPGGIYRLTFAMAPNPQSSTAVSSASVLIDGVDLKDLSFTNATANPSSSEAMNWTMQTLIFTSTSASTTIEFRATNRGSGGPELTDVQLSRIK